MFRIAARSMSHIVVSGLPSLTLQAPFSRGVENHVRGRYETRTGDQNSDNALAVMFRIVVPVLLYIGAAAITRWGVKCMQLQLRVSGYRIGNCGWQAGEMYTFDRLGPLG